MKKNALWGIGFFVSILALGGWFFFSWRILPAERVFPKGALTYLRISDTEKLFEGFKNSDLGKEFFQIKWEPLARQFLPPASWEEYLRWQKQLTDPQTQFFLKRFLGREVSVAFYPVVPSAGAEALVPQLLTSVVFAVRPHEDAHLWEWLSQLRLSPEAKFSLKRTRYRGVDIFQYEAADKPFIFYSKLKGLVILSFAEGTIRKSIDAFREPALSLAQAAEYRSVQKRLPPQGQVYFYHDVRLLLGQLKYGLDAASAALKKDPQEFQSQWQMVTEHLAGFESGVSRTHFGPEAMEHHSLLSFHPDEVSAFFKEFNACTPTENHSLEFIPKDVLLYQWGGCFNARFVWDTYLKEFSQEKMASAKEGVSRDTASAPEMDGGVSFVQELVPLLGKEWGWALTDISFEGHVPLPRMLFFIKVSDPSAVLAVLEKGLAKVPILVVQSESHQGIQIKYVSFPGMRIEPGYCALKDFLLFSSNREVLESSVSASKEAALSLQQSADRDLFISPGLAKDQSVALVRVGLLMDRIQKVLDWAGDWMLAQDTKISAYRSGQLKRLADVQLEIQLLHQRHREVLKAIRLASLDVGLPQDEGEPTEFSASGKERLQILSEELEKEIEVARDTEREVSGIVARTASKMPNLEPFRYAIKEIVYPLLDGLKEWKVLGSRTAVDDKKQETRSILKREPLP